MGEDESIVTCALTRGSKTKILARDFADGFNHLANISILIVWRDRGFLRSNLGRDRKAHKHHAAETDCR